jgi:hypothetical protein
MGDVTPRKNHPVTIVVGLATVFLLFPLGVVFMAAWLVATIALHLALLVAWLPRGRRVLFVYSDSPSWKPYLDEHVVPRLPRNAVILNWSERARWSPFGLGVWLFRMWSGARDFNPIAMVVTPWRGPKLFRFWSAFDERERGNPEPLRDVQAAFLAAIGSATR